MNIKIYSMKRDGNINITKNITLKELQCHDRSDVIKNDLVITSIVQYTRDVYNKPALIEKHSAYRTFDWNIKEGGEVNSKHVLGCAIDYEIANVKQQDLANLLYSIGLKRVGVYSSFVHADTDIYPIWLSQGNFKKVTVPFLGNNIKLNDKNNLVCMAQWKLNQLGFDSGIEDGIFGNKTLISVKNFQSKNKLISDGIIGKNTWKELFR